MLRHPILGTATFTAAAMIGLIGSTPTLAATSHGAKAPAQTCTSTSSVGVKASKFNITPKGSGPWHVPLDPCNPEGTGLSSPPYDDCAYWAAEKRPDIWANAVDKYGWNVAPGGAWNIELDARRAHYSISHTPKAGDIAAWPPNASMGHATGGMSYTASPGGHVAYVEKVHGARITISTMGVSNHGGRTVTLKVKPKTTYFIHQTHK